MVQPTHGVYASGLFVLEENKLVLLQLPVVHKLSISHDMPKGAVPRPVTGDGDLQGTNPPSPPASAVLFPFLSDCLCSISNQSSDLVINNMLADGLSGRPCSWRPSRL